VLTEATDKSGYELAAVMLSPRGQSGLEAKILASASASNIWPRPGLDLVVLSSLECILNKVTIRYTDFYSRLWYDYYVIGHFSGKNRVKLGNFVNFSGINLKSYVVNHYLVLFWPRPWPLPPEIGLGLEVLAWFNITGWQVVLLYFVRLFARVYSRPVLTSPSPVLAVVSMI